MNLSEVKSLLVNTIYCEIDFLQKANFDCANQMLQYRQAIHLRMYIIDCLLDTYPAENKALVEYLFEQCKELIQMMTLNKC
jgi:hypothetical protein